MGKIEIVPHIIEISSLGSLDKDCQFSLRKLRGIKPKKVVDIWEKDW
jgi:hypothetical protein